MKSSSDLFRYRPRVGPGPGPGGGPRRAVRAGRGPVLTAMGAVVAMLAAYLAIVTGGSAVAADTLLSQGKPATASSTENAQANPASAAVDGDTTTRWSSQFSDPQWLQVDLGSTQSISKVVLNWESAFAKTFTIQTSDNGTTWTNITPATTGQAGVQTLTVTGSGRYVRMNATARASGYGDSLWEFQVYGGGGGTTSPPTGTCGTTDAALNKPSKASSSENGAGTDAPNAFDGNTNTRWSSVATDPQWVQVDLGSSQTVCQVILNWEAAYGTSFKIQVSDNGTSWTDAYSTTTGTGGVQTLAVNGTGRYVRMYGTVRANGYGYSLWEFTVHTTGPPVTGTTPPVTGTTPPVTGTTPPVTGTTPPNNGTDPWSTPVTIPGNWTPVWSDSFEGAANTAPLASNWLERTGTQYPGGAANWGTGSVETDTDSTANVALDGSGKLAIKAVKDGAGKWTSGRIETKRDDFVANAGEQVKFTAVLKQPDVANALGYWPGFRATGAAYRTAFNNWPGVGESDIMTDVNGRSQLSQTLHCGTAPGGVCNEYDGRTSGLASCATCQTAYHEYSQVIDRSKTNEEVRFYLDGHQTWVVQESQVGVKAWEAALHHGFYLRLDLAMGGSLPNANAGTTTPTGATTSGGVLSVDSVSVTKIAAGTVPAAMTDPATPAGPSVVKVTGSQGNWALNVNGQPWTIKGLTYGPPQGAADGYIRDLKAAGVNTVRTWGVDDTGSPVLLNTAAQQGMKVIMGEWLNQGADYVNDQAYKDATKASILAQVNALKGYQGLLMWDVGNEVILTMQDHGLSAAEVEARRVAYAKYVDELAVAIHAADPNHPVTSTDAYTGAWPYYKQYAPHLDLLAVNSYGAIGNVKKDWIDGGYTKPYIVTEGGPAGEWEVPNDVNGVPTEPTDLQKRDGYTASWNAIASHPGVALGVTEFHYGTENDFGGVWLNTFTGGWHRLGFGALQKAYTGTAPANTAPEINSLTLSSQTSVPAGGTLTVNAAVTDPQGDPIRYNLMYDNKYVPGGGTGLTNVVFTQTAPGQFSAVAPQTTGVWKVYVYAFDGHGNVGIDQKSFKVVAPTVPGTNIAKGKTATASSFQPTGTNGPQSPALAVDGDIGTRWASEWLVDPEWIQVDLGSNQTFDHVQLAWESAYAKSYKVQTSTDGTNWTDYYSTTAGDGGFDQIDKAGSGRYVRMTGTVRALADYGYSLYEFGVYKN